MTKEKMVIIGHSILIGVLYFLLFYNIYQIHVVKTKIEVVASSVIINYPDSVKENTVDLKKNENQPEQQKEVPEVTPQNVEPVQPTTQVEEQPTTQVEEQPTAPPAPSTPVDAQTFMYRGVINYGGYNFKYYNLPMQHVEELRGETGWYVRGDGVWCTAEGYVIVASNPSSIGTLIDTPLGMGKIEDGCVASTSDPSIIDVAVTW